MASNNHPTNKPSILYSSLEDVTHALRAAVCAEDRNINIDINQISQLVDRYKEINYRLQNPNRYRKTRNEMEKPPNTTGLSPDLQTAMGLSGGTKKRCYGKNKNGKRCKCKINYGKYCHHHTS